LIKISTFINWALFIKITAPTWIRCYHNITFVTLYNIISYIIYLVFTYLANNCLLVCRDRQRILDEAESFNGFTHNYVPRRITGLMVKRQSELFYFVQWVGHSEVGDSFAIEADVMSLHCPNMVIEFHQNMILNPPRYQFLN